MSREWSRRAILAAAGAGAGLSAIGLLVAGCDQHGGGRSSNSEVRFRDLTGAEIALPGPAERIVDLWTVGTAFAIAAHGSPARMVAVNNRAHEVFKRGLIGRLYPETLDIPSDVLTGNGAPNIERLIKLNPDLVVDFAQDARGGGAAMRNAGLQVARYTEVEGGILPTIAALLRMYGQMIGDTKRADHIVAVMEKITGRLSALRPVPQSARPKVLQVIRSGDRFSASGGGAGGIYSDFIYLAGGVNAAVDVPGLSPTSIEQIATWNPDVILLFQSGAVTPATIYDHPILGGGKAARERRVYVVPVGTNNWGSMGPDEFLSPIWLAELLYPGRMEKGLREDMRQAYTAIFGQPLSDTDINGILRTDLNGDSAGYARFSGGS